MGTVACGGGPSPAKAPDETKSTPAARQNLDDGEQTIDASLKDCTTACKALASMERARDALCNAEPKECDGAKLRVDKARAKVVAAGCTCSGS